MSPIELDCHLNFWAVEVDDVASDWHLPSEFETSETAISQPAPHATLGTRRVSAHCASMLLHL
jgi:hypothetical protein